MSIAVSFLFLLKHCIHVELKFAYCPIGFVTYFIRISCNNVFQIWESDDEFKSFESVATDGFLKVRYCHIRWGWLFRSNINKRIGCELELYQIWTNIYLFLFSNLSWNYLWVFFWNKIHEIYCEVWIVFHLKICWIF